MITQEMNDRLTRVGPGTPMGNLLRCYWHPVGAVSELGTEPVQPVRLLGEDLVLFRDGRGRCGLIGPKCAHRAISLSIRTRNSAGLLPIGSINWAASLSRTAAVPIASTTSR